MEINSCFSFLAQPSSTSSRTRLLLREKLDTRLTKLTFSKLCHIVFVQFSCFHLEKKSDESNPCNFIYYRMIYIPSCHEKSSLAKNIHQVVQKDWLTQPIEGLRTCSTSLVQFDLLSKYSASCTGVSVG